VIYMADSSEYVDYAKVRDLLLSAQERRHELSYEQQMALQHSEWAASAQRGGIKTNSKVFDDLCVALQSNSKLADHPDVCAKISELMPLSVQSLRVIISSKRIAMDTEEVESIIDIVRQHVL
tara:strand:+ start:6214 stop:6579 length:366 start_codon:yes stop_codon:yes gene_type:complete